jgi:hypothetical protein
MILTAGGPQGSPAFNPMRHYSNQINPKPSHNMKNKILTAIGLCAVALASFTARAEEGGMGHYIPGEYLDFSGTPPSEPGLYLANYFVDYNHGTINASKELPLGGVFAAGVTVDMQGEVPVALYAYPWQVAHITFSSGIGVPWVWVDVQANAIYNRTHIQISGAKQQSTSGLGDIQVMPIMAGWTNGDFKVGGLFNVWAPSGNYTAGQLANPGMGYWTFEPMLAFSWLSTKFGTELTVFPAMDFNTINPNTSYQSGDIFHVDATLAQHMPLFGGVIGGGASVDYLNQFTGDSGAGAKLGSFEAESLAVGPTVSYVHKIGKAMFIADGSWLPQIHTQNSPKGNFFWVKLTLAF